MLVKQIIQVGYLQQYRMTFQTFESLIADIPNHRQYDHQIKQKRLRKQLSILSQYENPDVQFVNFQISPIGIILHLNHHFHNKEYPYNLVLDFQYPFNRPQIHYVHKQHKFAHCKDLIDNVLSGSNWGPSLMLTQFLDKLDKISELIQKEYEQAKWTYRVGQQYFRDYLQQMNVQILEIDQNTWSYMIKFANKRYTLLNLRLLGLTKQVIFKFQILRNNNLKLLSWKLISLLKEAKGTVHKNSYNLEITDIDNNKQYFVGKQVSNIQKIMSYLNPIEMIQRRVAKYQQLLSNKKIEETQLVKQLSQLIQFYSVTNSQKSQKYVDLMKKILQNQYNSEKKGSGSDEKQKQRRNQKQNIIADKQKTRQKEAQRQMQIQIVSMQKQVNQ